MLLLFSSAVSSGKMPVYVASIYRLTLRFMVIWLLEALVFFFSFFLTIFEEPHKIPNVGQVFVKPVSQNVGMSAKNNF